MEEDDDKSTKYVIFGKDLSKIPCFRESLMYGIGGGFAGGLAGFFITSNIRRANNFGMGSYILTTLVYWCKCRYDFTKTKHDVSMLQSAIERKTLYEGTPLEKEMEGKNPLDLKTV
ncbi:cytochrome c oxidase assembly factor COX20 lethal (3) 87Df [Arctopsyche grandis]|uniref:cytochrome c oxidase assembly factor COX20 lethal (3) 87Df n=1 Tax=Arctopsyche grandis TaxID=121162 RepID=UPI00406D8EE8